MDYIVSIIIPVYQVAPYIEDCLFSVMRQTYQGGIECLLIDDCGTDNSIEIAERMIREYNDNLDLRSATTGDACQSKNLEDGGGIRFNILHHEVNRGLSAARNTGTKAATGEYVFYLDSDDEITPDCMEKMMLMAETYPEAEMVAGGYQTIENGSVRSFGHTRKGEDAGWTCILRAEESGSEQAYCHTIITKTGHCIGVGWPLCRLIL